MMGELSGFIENMPYEEYAKVDALNGSSIIHMRRSPMNFRWKMDNVEPPTPALILGTATHRMILEPNRVGDFAVWGEKEEEKVRRGKVWDAFQEAHQDKMILTVDERDAMVSMAVCECGLAWCYHQGSDPLAYRDTDRGGRAHVPCKGYKARTKKPEAPMATEWTKEERKQAGVDLKKMYRKRGVDMLDVAYEAVMQRNRALAALKAIVPLLDSDLDAVKEWQDEAQQVHAAIAACEKGDA